MISILVQIIGIADQNDSGSTLGQMNLILASDGIDSKMIFILGILILIPGDLIVILGILIPGMLF